MGLFDKLKQGLSKTREGMVEKVNKLVAATRKIDEEFFEELEDILIQADTGVETTLELIQRLKEKTRLENLKEAAQVKEALQQLITELLGNEIYHLNTAPESPTVIMVVGVNGTGKTTTIGKLAAKFKQDGRKVILAAGDTFRAAAIDQLEIWSQRAGVPLIKQQEGSDPAAVAYDAVQAAKSRQADALLLDTAGRLQNKVNLMAELEKVQRVVARELPGAPHEVLLVLDATTGQNALSQAKNFGQAVKLTGIVLTKLDGTAKGGVILNIVSKLNVPVKLIGIGEGIEDLRVFEPAEFSRALFAGEEG